MPTKKIGKSETFNETEELLTWKNRRNQKAVFSGNPILSRYDLLNKVLKTSIPHGFTLNKLLELFADKYPEFVARHEKTGVIRLRKNNVRLFEEFIKECVSKARENEKENYITVDEILRTYRFSKYETRSSLERKIREFAKQKPQAVIKVSRIIEDKQMKTIRVLAIKRRLLSDFFKFSGLTINKELLSSKPKQIKLDPNTPGYKSDPTLNPISEEDMDAVAYRLAAKKISTKSKADAALLLELEKIAAQRGEK